MSMMKTLANPELETLELLIDKHDVQTVIEGLAQIASDKADHIRTNWQDEPMASQWDKLAAKLLNVALYAQDHMV